jgi:hypothetical protein
MEKKKNVGIQAPTFKITVKKNYATFKPIDLSQSGEKWVLLLST